MKTKIKIKSVLGSVIFELETEDNSFRETLEQALKSNANLSNADLSNADLRYADLSNADLSNADLRYANLSNADLRYADLSNADLSNADLRYADLSNADLRYAKNIPDYAIAQTRILPEGDLIGWKKCIDGVIVKLLIPAKAKRSNAFGRKCRASYVKTLEVIGAKVGIGSYDGVTKYIKGKITRADKWDDNFINECSNGIHFFITRLEAEKY